GALTHFGRIRDTLHIRARLLRHAREVLDERAVLDDGQGPAILRACGKLPCVIDRLLALPVPVPAPQLEADLPKALGYQQGVDGAESQRIPDLFLPVRGEASVCLPDLLHQALDELFLAHPVEA